MTGLRWGVVATIKASARDTLAFASYHLQAGAHRIFIYLDAPEDTAFAALKAHPRCRVTLCDAAYWQKRGSRPDKHQVRQSLNATHAYRRASDVDWLIHMDVDEFLVAQRPIATTLAEVPADTLASRVRPMEQLAGDGTAFKAFIPADAARARITRALYPNFGDFLRGGFLSHLAGKVFVRTGLPDVRLQIHNAFEGETALPTQDPMPGVDLAHCHAGDWDSWSVAYAFRRSKGSYRAELAPNRERSKGGMNLHDVFATLEAEGGKTALRAFFDEVCADTPALRARLQEHGLLRHADLQLDRALATHFPNVTL